MSYTIHVSETVYHRLEERANQFQLTTEQLIERLLLIDLLSFIDIEDETAFVEPMPPANSDEALAAVQRLSTCFADITIPNLEAILNDPLMSPLTAGTPGTG